VKCAVSCDRGHGGWRFASRDGRKDPHGWNGIPGIHPGIPLRPPDRLGYTRRARWLHDFSTGTESPARWRRDPARVAESLPGHLNPSGKVGGSLCPPRLLPRQLADCDGVPCWASSSSRSTSCRCCVGGVVADTCDALQAVVGRRGSVDDETSQLCLCPAMPSSSHRSPVWKCRSVEGAASSPATRRISGKLSSARPA
jgi:hypothetical protein